jgi:lipoprotein-anchoring transpeptidase ErfK/SrfK
MDGDSQNGGKRRRRLLAGLAGLIPIVPIIVGVLLSSGGSAAQASNSSGYTPSASPQPGTTHFGSPASSQLSPTPDPAGLPPGRGSVIAYVPHGTDLRVSPGGRRLARLPAKTEFGSPQVLWVVAHTDRWLGVVSTLAGNGRIGWIPRSAASLSRTTWQVKVSLSARRLSVLHDGKLLAHYTVAVGRSTAPTPTGRFAVTDRLNTNDPAGPYGCCILALSAHSPHAIQGWNGGNRIAIHSTPETASIGQPDSHGCVRVTLPEGRWLLAHVPLGTPTLISS